jgi:hypothetical protein
MRLLELDDGAVDGVVHVIGTVTRSDVLHRLVRTREAAR